MTCIQTGYLLQLDETRAWASVLFLLLLLLPPLPLPPPRPIVTMHKSGQACTVDIVRMPIGDVDQARMDLGSPPQFPALKWLRGSTLL